MNSAASGGPQDAALQQQQAETTATAATTTEADVILKSQYRALAAAASASPFATAGLGLGASSMAMNSLLLQQDMLRRQELERAALSGTRGLAYHGHEQELELRSRHENELRRLRQNQMMEAELASRSRLAAAAERGSGLPVTAACSGLGGLGLSWSSNNARAFESDSRQYIPPTSQAAAVSGLTRLSAEERDKLSQVADQTYRTALEASGLPSEGTLATSEEGKNIGDKDLAHEAELHNNVQRRLMEQEALAEQQKKHAVALQRSALVGGDGFDLTRAELIRRQQHNEMLRLLRMQQFQSPGEDLLSVQSRIGDAMAMSMANPYLTGRLGGLPHTNIQTMYPMIDPQVVPANIEKAYTAKGSPENNIISKFLRCVSSRVPEIMDLLARFFPVDLVDNPARFRAGFPRVVEATLEELKMMQDKTSKENGYKSRGLFDRVTNCIAAVTLYKHITTSPEGVATLSDQAVARVLNDSKPAANLKSWKMGVFDNIDTWTCHKCGNDNMATKARCSTCQGWKGGVRENKPKKRKKTGDSTEKTQMKGSKKKAISNTTDTKNEINARDSAESSAKPTHVLLQNCNKISKSKPLPTQSKRLARPESDIEHEESKSARTKIFNGGDRGVSENDREDNMDVANTLLGLMGGSSN